MSTLKRTIFAAIILMFLCTPGLLAAAPPTDANTRSGGEKHSEPDKVDMILSRMSLEQKIGQLFIVAADGDLEEIIRTYHPGGFILFSRHTPTLMLTMELIERIRQSSPLPPFIAVDQEGGRVSRLPFATAVPDARSLGTLPLSSLQAIGSLVGQELRALGFNMNFAPVLDVDTCAENPVIGNRSFSPDPDTVARLGTAYIRGLSSAGIAASAKHFPGHGDASSDSHLTLPIVDQSENRLQTREMLPFRAALRSGVDSVLIAHVSYPSLDPAPNRPASLSYRIVTEILRTELEYTGIIITDAMNMQAITNIENSAQAAKNAFMAGVDIVLMPEHLPSAYSALLSAVVNGDIPVNRVDESLRRILILKDRLGANPQMPFISRMKSAAETVGSPAHKRMMEIILNGMLPADQSQTEQ